MQSPRRVVELVLAALVLLITIMTFADLPRPYPSWPTIGPVPVDPELVLPGLLGFVTLLSMTRMSISIGSVVVGVLGALTLSIAVSSLYTLYTGTGGASSGVGFTLSSAGPFSLLQ